MIIEIVVLAVIDFILNAYKGSAKYLFLENVLKKITEYFLKFLFLFENTILLINDGK